MAGLRRLGPTAGHGRRLSGLKVVTVHGPCAKPDRSGPCLPQRRLVGQVHPAARISRAKVNQAAAHEVGEGLVREEAVAPPPASDERFLAKLAP